MNWISRHDFNTRQAGRYLRVSWFSTWHNPDRPHCSLCGKCRNFAVDDRCPCGADYNLMTQSQISGEWRAI